VRVIEIAQASKTAALRAADDLLNVFPRIYLDADVILPATSARLVIESLQLGAAMAVRPQIIYDTSHSDPVVRSHYRALVRVKSGTHSLWGGGVYGLSQAGRSRFSAYPDLVADDLFADQWFKPSEIEIVDTATATVTVPRRARDLIHVARRSHKGNVDLRGLPDGPPSTVSSTLHSLLSTAVSGLDAAMDTLVFLGIRAIVRISVAIFPPAGWSRDESSRA
jgi:hypothetical protein